jgi:uncharacterized C2H2 Zn-finger protein
MKHPIRRLTGIPAAIFCTFLFLAPAAALADHDRHRGHDDRGRHASFHHEPRLEIHTGWRFGPRFVRHRQHARATSYYCERCHHGFRRRRAFHRHLHHAHAVPFARLPFVLVHTSFGWVFGG